MARENKPGSPKRAGKSGGPVAKPKAKASTSYSPAPMSAAAKAKAKAAGAKTAAKIKNPMGLKQMNFDKAAKERAAAKSKSTAAKVAGVVGKVAGRAKTVAREVRDVKTAVGTSLRDQEQNVRRAAMGVKPTGRNVGKNLRTQIKEVVSAATSGKKGTTSDTYNRPGAYNKGTKRK